MKFTSCWSEPKNADIRSLSLHGNTEITPSLSHELSVASPCYRDFGAVPIFLAWMLEEQQLSLNQVEHENVGFTTQLHR